uniref:Variant surface glycoprotein 811 n=1 Tax=Trypanosoma brucei TaxID=5691 RepID=M4SYS1_9TRYP|nr:variant surface glycoprotein 811 [Trypanosoma brucei]
MKFYRLGLTLMALFSLAIHNSNAAVKSGENKALFAKLCTLMTLADSPITISNEAVDSSSEADMINQLNMTFSSPQWRKMFKKQPGKENWVTEVPDAYKKYEGWADMWPKWLSSYQAEEADTAAAKTKALGIDQLIQAQKHVLRPVMFKQAARAQHLIEEMAAAKREEQNEDAKQAQRLLKQAAYGNANKARSALTATDIFGSGCDTTTSNCCDNTASKQVTTTIAALQLCVCAAGSTTTDVCLNPSTPLTQWTNGHTGAANNWKAIAAHCSGKATVGEPERVLEQTVADILSSLHLDTSALYLGAYVTTNCGASQATGFCVKYASDASGDMATVEGQPWLQKVRQVISGLRTSRQGAEKAKQIKATLTKLVDEIKTEVSLAKTLPDQQPETTALPVTAVAAAGESCTTHKTNGTCPKNNCKWDGKTETEGTCKPKERKEQKTQGTEKGKRAAGTTKEECKGKLEPECTKAPECKWEGTECKNFSILVNKKLALSMTAAFASLGGILIILWMFAQMYEIC